MEISEARAKYIFTTKFEFEDGEYIILREPTSFELKDFGEDGGKNYEILQKLFPKCLVEHSFTDGGQPARNEKVSAILLDSGTQFNNIISSWLESLELKKKKDKTLEM